MNAQEKHPLVRTRTTRFVLERQLIRLHWPRKGGGFKTRGLFSSAWKQTADNTLVRVEIEAKEVGGLAVCVCAETDTFSLLNLTITIH